ncbi:unnamed protein product [Caenorhabditis bovis]|uniref:Uncharacterized protein n=1 Tax=Caenorhabditis bovis TaxID=2654633 RepID=A0A8S1F665_9PELO|nr:unnamed protein product [Caenorhabditis bovis]
MRLIIVVALLVAVVVSQAQEMAADENAGLADFNDLNRMNSYRNARLDNDGIPDKPEDAEIRVQNRKLERKLVKEVWTAIRNIGELLLG